MSQCIHEWFSRWFRNVPQDGIPAVTATGAATTGEPGLELLKMSPSDGKGNPDIWWVSEVTLWGVVNELSSEQGGLD